MNEAIILWILLVLFGAYKGFEFLKKYSNAPKTCLGTIVDKDEHVEWKGLPRRRYIKCTYWFVFEIDNQQKLTLFCDGNDYGRFNVGDLGTITYSGEMLLKFEKENVLNVL